MISHDVLGMGYQSQKIKIYFNDVYAGQEKYSGFYTTLVFQSPYWGGISFYSTDQDNTNAAGNDAGGSTRRSFSFHLKPSIGRFISDRFLLGGELNIYLATDKTNYFSPNDSEENTFKYTTLGIGPYIRYYFGKLKGKQLFHAGLSGGVNYAIINQESSDNGGAPLVFKSKQPTFYAKPSFGSSWFAGKHWSFGLSASCHVETFQYTLSNSSNNSSKRKASRSDIGLDGSVSFTF